MIRRNADRGVRDLERRWRAGERTYALGVQLAQALLRQDRLTVQWFAELGEAAAQAVAEADRNLAAAIGRAGVGTDLGWAGAYAQVFDCELFLDHHSVETCPRGHPLMTPEGPQGGPGARVTGYWDVIDLEPATWSDIDSYSHDRITFWGNSEHHDGPICNGVDGRSVMLRCSAFMGPDGKAIPGGYRGAREVWGDDWRHHSCDSAWFAGRGHVDFR